MTRHSRPIHLTEVHDGLCGQLPTTIWRAYGVTEEGRRFQLPDARYDVLYPLDEKDEGSLRRQATRQYPGHPFIVEPLADTAANEGK